MTATAERPATTATDSARPAWVEQRHLDAWTRWVVRDPNGTQTSSAVAPYDGQVTAEVSASTAADVEAAVATARHAQRAWAQVPYGARAEVVLRFHDLLVERQDEVLDLIQWEMGKNRFSAWQEILQVANISRHYARHGASYLGVNKVRGAIPGL